MEHRTPAPTPKKINITNVQTLPRTRYSLGTLVASLYEHNHHHNGIFKQRQAKTEMWAKYNRKRLKHGIQQIQVTIPVAIACSTVASWYIVTNCVPRIHTSAPHDWRRYMAMYRYLSWRGSPCRWSLLRAAFRSRCFVSLPQLVAIQEYDLTEPEGVVTFLERCPSCLKCRCLACFQINTWLFTVWRCGVRLLKSREELFEKTALHFSQQSRFRSGQKNTRRIQ